MTRVAVLNKSVSIRSTPERVGELKIQRNITNIQNTKYIECAAKPRSCHRAMSINVAKQTSKCMIIDCNSMASREREEKGSKGSQRERSLAEGSQRQNRVAHT